MWRIVTAILLAWLLQPHRLSAAPRATTGEADRRSIRGLVDRVVMKQMREDHIAGAIVAVVTPEESVMERGYGFAAPGRGGAADPSSSIFRIGSVSKVFTYVAIMQLASRGRIDIEADANRYLPASLRIAGEGLPPIKVWHLMTHTAGFEDSSVGALLYLNGAPIPPLEAYLAAYRPQRVRPPGLHTAYSNYSAALLGAMIAHVSGELYERYVERHVFAPLQMRHTTCREPLLPGDPRAIDARRARALATPFAYSGGKFVALPQPRVAFDGPAGACSSTAADMARFVRMLLGRGSVDGREIVPAAYFDRYSRVRFSEVAGGAEGGLAYGLFRLPYDDMLSIEHAGDLSGFHAKLSLLPGAGIGIFVAVNSDGGAKLTRALPDQLFRYRIGATHPAGRTRVKADPRFAGYYLPIRRNYTTVEKAAGLLQSLHVERTDAGYVKIGDRLWQQIGPRDFAGVGDAAAGSRLHFVEDDAGNIVAMVSAVQYWTRVGTLDDYRLLLASLAVTILASITTAMHFWRRRSCLSGLRGRLDEVAVRHDLALAATFLVWAASLGMLLIAMLQLDGIVTIGPTNAIAYPSLALRIAHVLAHLAAAGGAVLFLSVHQIWRSRAWSTRRKLRHSATLGAMMITVALMVHYNLLAAHLLPG